MLEFRFDAMGRRRDNFLIVIALSDPPPPSDASGFSISFFDFEKVAEDGQDIPP